MIILVKLDKSIYEKISTLVKEGKYPSIESFVELAVRNQMLLESEESPDAAKSAHIQDAAGTVETLLSTPRNLLKIVDTPSLAEGVKNAPLWGQINRLAPAKFVLRILANRLASLDNDTMDLKRFSAEVAEKATEFRTFARKRDKISRVRGGYLHIAFPKKDPSSQQRFLNYYVGKAPLQRWTDGVLVGLSLANIKEAEDGSKVVGLTQPGLKFAQLNSPLIDEFFLKEEQINSPFSNEEASFLVSHIKSFRPGEYEFMTFTLDSIKRGADTPTRLQDRLGDFLKKKDLRIQLSDKVTNTMQVGVIGRLVEMGLLKIEKDAQKSKYLVADKVEELVGKL